MTQHEQISEFYRERKRILDEHLPQHLRDLQAQIRQKPKKRPQREEAKYELVKHALSVLLTGGTREETELSGCYYPLAPRDILRKVWPFSVGERYVAVRIPFNLLAALDSVASDLGVPRQKALERICSICLEEGAAIARRMLHLRRTV